MSACGESLALRRLSCVWVDFASRFGYIFMTPFFGRLVMPIAAALAGIAQLIFAVVLFRREIRSANVPNPSDRDSIWPQTAHTTGSAVSFRKPKAHTRFSFLDCVVAIVALLALAVVGYQYHTDGTFDFREVLLMALFVIGYKVYRKPRRAKFR